MAFFSVRFGPLALLALVAAGPAPAPAPPRPAAPPVAALPPSPLPVATPESIGLSTQALNQVMGVLSTKVAEGRIAGAVFGIARHGKLGWLQAVGFRDGDLRERLTADAIFPLASMTKPIASVAAMVLVERGKLGLADPLSLYLPAFRSMKVMRQTPGADGAPPTQSLEPAARPITVQDVLRHTAGFINGNLSPNNPLGQQYIAAKLYDNGTSLTESVDKLAALPLGYQPGSKWEYSIAVDVLARVVEVVSGETFADFVAKNVTGPLRMTDTAYWQPETATKRFAAPRINPVTGVLPAHQDMLVRPVRIGGNSGLTGTAGDYLRFGQAMLNGGGLDGVRVLGAGTVANMTSDHLGTIPHDTVLGQYLLGPGRGFGLGFSVRITAGLNPMPGSVGDFDWGGAYGTQFLVDPQQDIVAVLMVNQQNQFDHVFRLFRTLVYQTLLK